MDDPKIVLNGKEYSAPQPKTWLWREVVRLQNKKGDQTPDDEAALDEMEKLIVATFNNSEVTVEAIEKHLDLDKFMPLFLEICDWIAEKITGKAQQLPNG
ncbi:MAG: hypothetical protein ABFD08_08095 [Syntrophomonas sp.]